MSIIFNDEVHTAIFMSSVLIILSIFLIYKIKRQNKYYSRVFSAYRYYKWKKENLCIEIMTWIFMVFGIISFFLLLFNKDMQLYMYTVH